MWRLGGERCEFGTEACGLGMGEGKGGSGESGSGKFRLEGWVSGMGEGAEEKLSCVVGHEASGVGGFVAKGMEVESERGVGQKSLTKWMGGGNGGVKGLKNVLGGKVGVGMDMGGIVLH